jgi:hypothetical protein
MRLYMVSMAKTWREHAIVTVRASDSDAARREARRLDRAGEVEFCDGRTTGVRVTGCDAKPCRSE